MIKFLKIDIYDVVIVFLVEPTKTEFELMYHDNVTRISDNEYQEMYEDIFNNNKCGGFTVLLKCTDYAVCVKDAMNFNYAIHEIIHATNKILLSRGVSLDRDPDGEPFAYLGGYLAANYFKYITEERIAKIERL